MGDFNLYYYLNEVLKEPFFYARKSQDKIITRGIPSCFMGHKIQNGKGEKDDGVFAEWQWDGNSLTVKNDRYGFYPIYYYYKESEICISPSIIRLVKEGAVTNINYNGLSVFLRCGFFVGDNTPFEYIHVVPPDTIFKWQGGQLEVSGKYAIGKVRSISRDEAIDTYISLFRKSIQKRLPADGNFAVLLSGGLDSRHILFELCNLKYRPRFCITTRHYPPRSNLDEEIATKVTAALGLEHIIINQNKARFKTEFRKNILTNLCSQEHAWLLELADYLKGKVSTIYDGIGGNTLSFCRSLTPKSLEQFGGGKYYELAEGFLERYGENVLSNLLSSKKYIRLSRELAINELILELKKHEKAPNPMVSFRFWTNVRRNIVLSPYRIFREIENVMAPYIEQDLFDFLTSLPANMLLDKKFHIDTIRRAYPRYANIPFDKECNVKPLDAREHNSQFTKALAWYVFTRNKQPSQLMRNHYFIPRLVYCLVNRSYRESFWWLSPPLILYLFQLEMVAGGKIKEN